MSQKEDIFVSKKSSCAVEIAKKHGDGCDIFSVFERKTPHAPVFISNIGLSAAEIEKNHGGGCLKKKTILSLKKVPAWLRLQKSMVMDVAFSAYLKEKYPMPLFLYLKIGSSATEIEKNHAGGCLKKKTILSLKKVPARLRLQKR